VKGDHHHRQFVVEISRSTNTKRKGDQHRSDADDGRAAQVAAHEIGVNLQSDEEHEQDEAHVGHHCAPINRDESAQVCKHRVSV